MPRSPRTTRTTVSPRRRGPRRGPRCDRDVRVRSHPPPRRPPLRTWSSSVTPTRPERHGHLRGAQTATDRPTTTARRSRPRSAAPTPTRRAAEGSSPTSSSRVTWATPSPRRRPTRSTRPATPTRRASGCGGPDRAALRRAGAARLLLHATRSSRVRRQRPLHRHRLVPAHDPAADRLGHTRHGLRLRHHRRQRHRLLDHRRQLPDPAGPVELQAVAGRRHGQGAPDGRAHARTPCAPSSQVRRATRRSTCSATRSSSTPRATASPRPRPSTTPARAQQPPAARRRPAGTRHRRAQRRARRRPLPLRRHRQGGLGWPRPRPRPARRRRQLQGVARAGRHARPRHRRVRPPDPARLGRDRRSPAQRRHRLARRPRALPATLGSRVARRGAA